MPPPSGVIFYAMDENEARKRWNECEDASLIPKAYRVYWDEIHPAVRKVLLESGYLLRRYLRQRA